MPALARVLPITCLCIITQAWADDSANAKSAPDKKTVKVTLVDNDINDEDLKQILAKGYRPKAKGDKVVYCRSETPLGTRFSTTICRSSAQILADELHGKEAATAFQKDNGNPAGK